MPWPSKVLIDTTCVKDKPLFHLLLWDHEDSDDGGLSRRSKRHQATPSSYLVQVWHSIEVST